MAFISLVWCIFTCFPSFAVNFPKLRVKCILYFIIAWFCISYIILYTIVLYFVSLSMHLSVCLSQNSCLHYLFTLAAVYVYVSYVCVGVGGGGLRSRFLSVVVHYGVLCGQYIHSVLYSWGAQGSRGNEAGGPPTLGGGGTCWNRIWIGLALQLIFYVQTHSLSIRIIIF